LKLAKNGVEQASEAGEIHKLIEEAMHHASDVAHDLATLDFRENDLPEALQNLADHARKAFKIACRIEGCRNVPPLESNVVRQLYKIAQEALTNAIKHGKARRVGIELIAEADSLVLTIRNNGIPFPSVVSRNAGMGLRIMNYRANLIGAAIDIKPGKPDGTVITCAVPAGSKKLVVQPA
jgi:signal transduction histidine kinase